MIVPIPYAAAYQQALRCQLARDGLLDSSWRLAQGSDGVRVYVNFSQAAVGVVCVVPPALEPELLSSTETRTARLHASLPQVRLSAPYYNRFAELVQQPAMANAVAAAAAAASVPAVTVSVAGYRAGGAFAVMLASYLRAVLGSARPATSAFSFGAPMMGYSEVSDMIRAQDLATYRLALPTDPTIALPGTPFSHASPGLLLDPGTGAVDGALVPRPDAGLDHSLEAYVEVIGRGLGSAAVGGGGSTVTDVRFRTLFVNGSSLAVPDSGNVGIGVSFPLYTADVRGDIHASNGILVGRTLLVDADRNVSNVGTLGASLLSVGSHALVGGSVGVGTNAPAARVDVASGDLRLGAGGIVLGNTLVLGAGRSLTNIATLVAGPSGGRLLLSSNGFVGVRTNVAPRDALDVGGTIRTQNGLRLRGTTILTPDAALTNVAALSVGSTALVVSQGTGFVGIGTDRPAAPLHVQGNCRVEGTLQVQGDFRVNGALQFLQTDVQSSQLLRITGNGAGPAAVINQTGAQPILDVQDDGATALYVADGGRVGIRTAAPAADLDVHGSLAVMGTLLSDPTRNLSNVASVGLAAGGRLLGVAETGGVAIYAGASGAQEEALRVDGGPAAAVRVTAPLLEAVGELRAASLQGGSLSLGGALLGDASRALSNVASLAVAGGALVLSGERVLSNLAGVVLSGPLSVGGTTVLGSDRRLGNVASLSLDGDLVVGGRAVLGPDGSLANVRAVAASESVSVGRGVLLQESAAVLPNVDARALSVGAGNASIDASGAARVQSLSVGGLRVTAQGGLANAASLDLAGPLIQGGVQLLGPGNDLSNLASLALAPGGTVAAGPLQILSPARGLQNLTSLVVDGPAAAQQLALSGGPLQLGPGADLRLADGRVLLSAGDRQLSNVAGVSAEGPVAVGGAVVLDGSRNLGNVGRLEAAGPLVVGGAQVLDGQRALSNVASADIAGDLRVGGTLRVSSALQLLAPMALDNLSRLSVGGYLVVGPSRDVSNVASLDAGRLAVGGTVVLDETRALSNVSSVQVGGFLLVTGGRDLQNVASLEVAGAAGVGSLRVGPGRALLADEGLNLSNVGRASLAGPLAVGGQVLVSAAREVSNVSGLSVLGNASVSQGLTAGTLAATSDASVQGILSLGGPLAVGGATLVSPSRDVSNVGSLAVGGQGGPAADPVSYPAAPLTGASTTLVGVPGDGAYVVSASSTSVYGNPPVNAFDRNSATYFESGGNYNASTGEYTGATSTLDVGTGAPYYGDWLQVQLPIPVVPSGFVLVPRQAAPWYQRRAPRTFQVFGSLDGAQFTLLSAQADVISWSPAGMTVAPAPAGGAAAGRAWRAFRLVVGSVGSPSETAFKDYVNLAEFLVVGGPVGSLAVTSDGRLGVQTAAPRTPLHVEGAGLIAGPLTVGSLCAGPGAPVVLDASRNLSNLAAVQLQGPLVLGSATVLDSGANLRNVASLTVAGPAAVAGPASLGPGGAAAATATGFLGGASLRQAAWDAAGSSHSLAFGRYCSGNNSAGILYIQASNKSATNPKVGSLVVSFLKPEGGNVQLSTVSVQKTSQLNQLGASASGADVVVATDNDCAVTWTSIGAF